MLNCWRAVLVGTMTFATVALVIAGSTAAARTRISTNETFQVTFSGETPSGHPYQSNYTTYASLTKCFTTRTEATGFSFSVSKAVRISISGAIVTGFTEHAPILPVGGMNNASQFSYRSTNRSCKHRTVGPSQFGGVTCKGEVTPFSNTSGGLYLGSGSGVLTFSGLGPEAFVAAGPFAGTNTYAMPQATCADRIARRVTKLFLVEPVTTILLAQGTAELRSIFVATVHIPAARIIHLQVGQSIIEAVSPGHGAPSVASLNGDCKTQLAAQAVQDTVCTQSFDWRGTLMLKRNA